MSPAAVWTALTGAGTSWQEGAMPTSGGGGGTVDFIWGAFALTQPDAGGGSPATVYTELTGSAPSGTELSVAPAVWTELSG